MSTDNMIKFCPFCGTKVLPNAKFCIECGKQLTILNISNTENNSEDTISTNEKEIEIELNKDSNDISLDNNEMIEEQDNLNISIESSDEEPKNVDKNFNILNKNNSDEGKDDGFDLIRPNQARDLNDDSSQVKESKHYPNNNETSMAEHNSKGLPCPSCENNMELIQESGFFSKSLYHQCHHCLLKFKVYDTVLILEKEPEFTRMKSKLHLKKYTLSKWNEILHGSYTPEFTEEFSKWNFDSPSPFSCPACNNTFARYKSSGFGSKYYLICSGCGLILEERNNLYRLYDSLENNSPLWKYEKNFLTLDDFKRIINTEESEENKLFRDNIVKENELKIKKHQMKIKQQESDLQLFNDKLESGHPLLPAPSDNTIILKKNEVPVYKMYNVTLSEPRAVRKSTGSYGGASVRVSKGVTLHSGGTSSQSESHDEIKLIDSGELLITNQRVIFLGSNRTTNIDINKIISITSGPSMIQIQRSNKQKPEYFNNIYSTENFEVDGRQYSVVIDGNMVKKLIMGQVQA